MDCLLFRHGIAVDREDWDGPEPERPLTAKGAERTRQAAKGLARLDVVPTQILVQPVCPGGGDGQVSPGGHPRQDGRTALR